MRWKRRHYGVLSAGPPHDTVSVAETSTDFFCFGNPTGPWYLQQSNSPLLPKFNPAVTSLCGMTTMTLTAPNNTAGITQTYYATPMIGKNGASIFEVAINVPAHCPCYAAEIYAAATNHAVDPFIMASLAARESGGFPPDNDPLCGSMDPLNNGNGTGSDGTGHGLFQIDDGSWFVATTPAIKDPYQNADIAAIIFADNLKANGGNVTGALHDYNAGPNKSVATTNHYESGVLALKQQFASKNYSFACVIKQVSRADLLDQTLRSVTAFVRTRLLNENIVDKESVCA